MELSIDDRPDMATFTSSKEARVMAEDGSMCVLFEEGESKPIRKELFTAAIAAGLVPEDPLVKLELPPKPENKSTEEIVSTGLIEACKMLIAKGLAQDFTTVGQPRAASIKKLVDFHFTTKDVEAAFIEAMHEVDQDGDSSKEHSEPSISAAE